MAISKNTTDNENKKFVESTAVPGQPAVVVTNADGSNVGTGGSGSGANQVQGNVAAGAADTGNPVKVGGVFLSSPTAVTNGQRTNFLTDEFGQQKVIVLGTPTVVQTGNQATPTNRSGSITTGGTAQQLMAANANRRGFWIQNVSTGDLWINEVGTATVGQPSIKVPADGLYEAPSTGVATSAVSVIGATTGQAFSAREW